MAFGLFKKGGLKKAARDYSKWRKKHKFWAGVTDVINPVGWPVAIVLNSAVARIGAGAPASRVVAGLVGDAGAVVAIAGFLTLQPELVALGGAMTAAGHAVANGRATASDVANVVGAYQSADAAGQLDVAKWELAQMSELDQAKALAYGRQIANIKRRTGRNPPPPQRRRGAPAARRPQPQPTAGGFQSVQGPRA